MSSEYERLRLKNIEDNKRILSELGISNPFNRLPCVITKSRWSSGSQKRKNDSAERKPPAKKFLVSGDSWTSSSLLLESGIRRSQRIQGKEAGNVSDVIDELEQSLADEDGENRVKVPKDRPMVYGHIPGVPVGSAWMMRIEVNHAGVHRPTVAGIHPGPDGAYSIALSGGYEDDIDLGECFTYTGEGGRDLKGTKANPKNLRTAAQSKDQTLSRGNLALVRSVETGMPVRVLRGYKLDSPFAPDEGYRYDGLYKVEKWWFTTGLAGFGVYKFALRRIEDQDPPPWEYKQDQQNPTVDDKKLTECVGDLSQNSDIGFQISQSSVENEAKEEQTPRNTCPGNNHIEGVKTESDINHACDENKNRMNSVFSEQTQTEVASAS